jgi:tRNA(adenine34) deaminase
MLELRGLHSEWGGHELYTTMEPCPLCFGAVAMLKVGTVRYAARDRIAGAVSLSEVHPFIQSRGIAVYGPIRELGEVQLALKTDSVLRLSGRPEELLAQWYIDYPTGVEVGRRLHQEGILMKAREKNESVSSVFNQICGRL